MVRYGVNIFLIIEAGDKQELKDILYKIINTKFPEDISKRIIQMEWDSHVSIHDEDGELENMIII